MIENLPKCGTDLEILKEIFEYKLGAPFSATQFSPEMWFRCHNLMAFMCHHFSRIFQESNKIADKLVNLTVDITELTC